MGSATHSRVAIGFRAHSGWSVVVAVSGSPARPVVLDRRRIETADPGIRGSKQPYHAAESLSLQKGGALLCKCRESSAKLATDAVVAMVDQLTKSGHTVAGSGILYASGRPLPPLEAILKSHPLLHTAEGEFFREVLAGACEHCKLPVTRVKEREAWERGAEVWGLGSADLQQRIGELGRSLGPPWRQDEKLASLAAWIALAEPARASGSG